MALQALEQADLGPGGQDAPGPAPPGAASVVGPATRLDVAARAGPLHVADEVYAIPEGERFILYAPLARTALLVNAATAAALRDLDGGGRARLEADPGLLALLVRGGVVAREQPQPASARPEQGNQGFDPTGLTLFLTTGCSMRCVYCYAGGGDTRRVMPWPMARAALDWMVAHAVARGRQRFHLSFHGGGEVTTAFSLLRRCVGHVRQAAGRHGLAVALDAGLNGVMSARVVEWVVEHLDGATVSLDGLPEVQDAQRPLADGRGSSGLVAATLRRMDERGFAYGLRTTVTSAGVDRLPASVAYMSSRFRPRTIQVEPVHLSGRAVERGLAALAPERFVEAFRRAARQAAANGVELSYSGARLFTTSNAFCKAATGSAFALTPDGTVTGCYEVLTADDPRAALFHLGRLDAGTGRLELDAGRAARLAALTVERRPHCAGCFCKWHCAGDCPAKVASAGEPWDLAGSPRCHINRELTKDQLRQCLVRA